MAADCVKGQRWAILVGINYFTVRHKSQFDERLKAIAYAKHQAVAFFKQIHCSVPHLGIAEEGGYELGGAVRLVTAGEAAGDKYYLAVSCGTREAVNGFRHILRRPIVQHHYFRFKSGVLYGVCGIIFAVCAGEYGYQHLGDSHAHLGRSTGDGRRGQSGNLRCIFGRSAWIY